VPFLIQIALPAEGDSKTTRKETWITFLTHRTGSNLLYRMRPDGSDCKPIFGGPIKGAPGVNEGMTLYREPHWTWQSPDRKYFASWAWDSFRPQGKSTVPPRFRLHLGRSDGTGPVRLLTPVCQEAAAWSPGSERVAYAVVTDKESSAHPNPARMTRIYVVGIDGTSEDMIFEQPGNWTPQDWSPDGKKLLLTHAEIIRLKTGLMERPLRTRHGDGRENTEAPPEELLRAVAEQRHGGVA
jgi:hypothetical protein